MMLDIPEPEHLVLSTHLAQVVAAHDATRHEITNHAQRETAERDKRREKLEAERKLTEVQRGGP